MQVYDPCVASVTTHRVLWAAENNNIRLAASLELVTAVSVNLNLSCPLFCWHESPSAPGRDFAAPSRLPTEPHGAARQGTAPHPRRASRAGDGQVGVHEDAQAAVGAGGGPAVVRDHRVSQGGEERIPQGAHRGHRRCEAYLKESVPVFINRMKSFCKSQFQHKLVNLSFMCGNLLLQNDFINPFCEMKAPPHFLPGWGSALISAIIL